MEVGKLASCKYARSFIRKAMKHYRTICLETVIIILLSAKIEVNISTNPILVRQIKFNKKFIL